MTGRVWTISNTLSFCRIVLVVPIVVLLLRNDAADRAVIGGLIVLAAATDFFDGLLARRLGQVSDLGKIIDPVADKLAVGAAGIALAIVGRVPVWFLVAALVRDLVILAGGVYIRSTRGVVLQSNLYGKWAVVAMSGYLLLAALGIQGARGLETALLAASCVMMLVSGVSYAARLTNIFGRS